MTKVNKKISAVIPGYNEARNIPEMHQRLTSVLSLVASDYEIIFIDDKSTDSSREILKELTQKDKHVVAIFFARNTGHSQTGFTAGMEYSTGDAVVLMDGDLQDPPELIPEFIKKWQEGYDVVYGVRTKRKGPILLRVAYKLFYIIFTKLAPMKVPRDVGDFSLMDRKVVNVINSMPERDRYIRGLRALAGFNSTGVPYVRDLRFTGSSTNTIVKNIKWVKKAIFSFSYTPVEFIFWLALATFLISVAAIIYYIVSFFVTGPPRGFTTLLVAVLFLGSVQLLSLSIIAEYLSRVFEEVKARPKYVVEKILNDPRPRKRENPAA